MIRLWVPGPLPGLNDIIDAKRVMYGGRNDKYAAMKKKWGERIKGLAISQRLGRVEPGHFTYRFLEPNKRRDPLNFLSGGIKIIEDGLQEAGLLDNDGWRHVLSISTSWAVDAERPGVLLTIRGQDEA